MAGRVTVSPRNVSVQAEHDVMVNCSSQLATYWTFVEANNGSTEPRLICYRGLSLSENRQKYGCDASWSVVIRDFGHSDVGAYTCSTVSGHGRDTAILTLACTFVHSRDKSKSQFATNLQLSTGTSNLSPRPFFRDGGASLCNRAKPGQ